jgi:beta-lactamase superfamily II metal-dependent hydrolase
MKKIRQVFFLILTPVFPCFAFTVSILNVQQGSSAFIKLSDRSGVLVDAGHSQAAPHIIEFLKSRGIDTLRMAVLSHPDFAHIGGFEKIIESGAFVVGRVVKNRDVAASASYKGLMKTVDRKKIPVLVVKKDTAIGDIEFRNCGAFGGDVHERCLVVCYSDLGKSIAIMGDAEAQAEKKLMSIKADALVIGHHGSKTATSQKFLNAVRPEAAFISVGPNSFHHPTEAVLDRLKNTGIDIYRTDEMGDIIITVEDWKFKVKSKKKS